MTGENFCWLVVGFIAGRFVGDSIRDAVKKLVDAIRARGNNA
jgi:hypothetical protein